jgi:hypothetical protein
MTLLRAIPAACVPPYCLTPFQLKVLALDRILASKIAANRPKDRLTIPVLRDALAATQSIKQRPKTKRGSKRPRK